MAEHTASSPDKPAVWQPRFKRDPSIQATPYRPPPPRCADGEYEVTDIAKRLGGEGQHSFMVPRLAGTSTSNVNEAEGVDDDAKPLEQPRNIIAIINHRGANPSHVTGDSRELWTRHNLDAIIGSMSILLPFYTYSSSSSAEKRWRIRKSSTYVYAGTYKISEVQRLEPRSPEVLQFIGEREESKGEKTAAIWQDKLNSVWMKVTIVKCAPELQQPDPLLVHR